MGTGRIVTVTRHPDGYYITVGHPALGVQVARDKPTSIEQFIAAVTDDPPWGEEEFIDVGKLRECNVESIKAYLLGAKAGMLRISEEFAYSPPNCVYFKIPGGHILFSMERMAYCDSVEDLIREVVNIFYERRLAEPPVPKPEFGKMTKKEIEDLSAPAPVPPDGSESEEPPPPPPQPDREES